LHLIPGIEELFNQKGFLNKVRDVDEENLLGGEPVKFLCYEALNIYNKSCCSNWLMPMKSNMKNFCFMKKS